MLQLIFFLVSHSFAAKAELSTEIPPVQVRAEGTPLETGDLEASLAVFPNVHTASGANRARFLQVRGIGETGQFDHSQVSAVGVFYEGIDLSEEASTLPLLGFESSRFRAGPASLEWGPKALAGSLEVSSCLGECVRRSVRLELEERRTQSLTLGLAQSKWMLIAREGTSDGYMNNVTVHRATQGRDEREAVAGVRYRLGELQMREHHVWIHHRNGYDAWAYTPGFASASDHPGRDHHQVHGHSWTYQYGRMWGLTSLTSTEQRESYDEDWGADPAYNYFADFERRRLKIHQKIGFDAETWSTGVHYSEYREAQLIRSFKDEVERYATPTSVVSRQLGLIARTHGGKGDWRWRLGTRVEAQRLDNRNLTPQWGGEFALNNGPVEVALARGFRGAGVNVSPSVPANLREFGGENLQLLQLTYSATHSRWRSFYQWQSERQSRASVQVDPTDPNSFSYLTVNRGSSEGHGVEGEFLVTYGNWHGEFSAGWLRTRHRGRAMAQAPFWNYRARAEFRPRALRFYIEARGHDGYFHSEDHNQRAPVDSVVDAGARWEIKAWSIEAYVNNVTDGRHVTRAYYFANEPPAWREKLYEQWGAPRTVGVAAQFNF